MANTTIKPKQFTLDSAASLFDSIAEQFRVDKKVIVAAIALWILALLSCGALEAFKIYQSQNALSEAFKNNTEANSAKMLSQYRPLRPRQLPQRTDGLLGALEDAGYSRCINGQADLEEALRNKPRGFDTPYRLQ